MKKNNIPTRITLLESELPKYWYNLRADLKEKIPPMISPATKKPLKPTDLFPIFTKSLVAQEFDQTNRLIKIPDDVLQYYKTIRPSPLIRAYNLEKFLGTPAEIYFKFEGNNTSGSHKLNSAIPQVYYAKKDGITSLTTETGAGQWGTALSVACAYFNIPLTVFMVKISYEQKPQRKTIMQTFGANVISSPSNTTNIGKKILSEFKNTNGSLGCAISEAIEKSVTTKNCRYVLGSVLDHVLLHQSIIGQEVKIALDKYKIKPDIIIGCVGGGSNFGGLISPFIKEKISNPKKLRLIAVEPASCPTLTRGKYMYDFGDTGKTTPLIKMYTLGSAFIPSPSHAGGLRYHGMSPTISKLYRDGIIEARSVTQTEVFKANEIFSRTEGILPAPESGHAIKAAIDEAMLCKKNKTKKVIVFCLSGTGFFDLQAYSDFYGKKMIDKSLTKDELEKGFSSIPK